MNSVESFRTERIIAERLTANDIDHLNQMHQDQAVMQFVGGIRTKTETLEYLDKNLEHWKNHGYGIWILYEINNNEFIGRGALRRILVEGEEVVELGYALMQKYWGKGYASEFAVMVTEIAFSNFDIQEIVALTIPENDASKKVILKIGGTYDRDVIYKDSLCNLYRIKKNKNTTIRSREPHTTRLN